MSAQVLFAFGPITASDLTLETENGSVLLLFLRSTIDCVAICRARARWASELTTEIGIFVKGTWSGGSNMPSRNLAVIERVTDLLISSSVIRPWDNELGALLYAGPQSMSVPFVIAYATASSMVSAWWCFVWMN